MWAPNNPHACPSTGLYPGHGILKNKTLFQSDFLLDALGANLGIDGLESYKIDIWRRFAPTLGDTRVVAENAVLEWEVGEYVGEVCRFKLKVDGVRGCGQSEMEGRLRG